MNTNSDFLAGMRSHFKHWDEAVDVLSAEGKKADGEARTASQRLLKELRLTRSAAQRCYETLRKSGDHADANSQAGLQEAWEAMQRALLKASTPPHAPPSDPQPIASPQSGSDDATVIEAANPIAPSIEPETTPPQEIPK